MKRALLATAAAAALAFGTAGAVPSGSHVVLGTGNNGTDTLSIAAFENGQNGSALLNGTTQLQVVCVDVPNPGPIPGFHKAYVRATGGGAVWYIEIGDSPSGDALGVTNAPPPSAGYPCDVAVAATTVTTGGFTIAP